MDMVIYTLPFGDPVHRFDGNIVVRFNGRRKVLSTAMRNGGYREDLKYVYNHDGRCHLGVASEMNGRDIHEHTLNTILAMGLDPDVSAGMETAAHMENVSIKTEAWDGYTSVTAIVTGGIETNGGRVGDPGEHIEGADVPQEHRLGTINIMLAIDADLSPGCMTRAVVTCTEAKTAAIQELLAPSRYSRGLATGSGTDSTILIVNGESPRYLTDAGKHSKLGELIGKAVKAAVKEALYLQTGLCPASQHDAFKRLDRFGVTEEGMFRSYRQRGGALDRPEFSDRMERIALSGDGVALASVAAHLIDQLDWGLLTGEETVSAARLMLEGYALGHGVDFSWEDRGQPDECVLYNWKRLTILEIEK